MNWEEVAGTWAPAIGLISGAVLGWGGLLLARRTNKASAALGIATETRAGQAEIRADRENFIEALQEDNLRLRTRLDTVEVRVDVLTREVNRLYRKYGENGTTPPAGITDD